MKKNIILLFFGLLSISLLHAQESPWSLEWHGFVNPHVYADSRQIVGGREEMMLFYPKPIETPDPSVTSDIHDGWNMNMLSITARINLTIKGPDMLGARTKAFIEGDFTGSTNATNNNLRLRHAYLDFNWDHSEILAGQYWYPMTVQEIMPNTRPLNMGAPFHPYARYSQIRYIGRTGPWEAMAVALFQQDNMSQGILDGIVTNSSQFIRRGGIPEMHLQLRYNSSHLFAGVAANMLTIQPRVYTTANPASLPINYGETFSNFSYSAFLKYHWDNWAISLQTLLNNSLYEGCTMGGYYEHLSPVPGPGSNYLVNYESWHFNTFWADFGKTTGEWRPGMFLGFGYNADFGQVFNNSDIVMGRGNNIEYLWRVQPRIGFHPNKAFNLYAEAEYTWAQYGEKNNMGVSYHYVSSKSEGVGNMRLMLSAEYHF